MKPTIFLGTDHAGFRLKTKIRDMLDSQGYKVVDICAHPINRKDDYPDHIFPVAKEIARSKNKAKAIIFGYSGQGEAMVANRIKGVRAAAYYGGSKKILKLSREHNDANILSIGAHFVSTSQAKAAVKLWLNTPFSQAVRHKRRIKKLG